jgi:hypothetical protein
MLLATRLSATVPDFVVLLSQQIAESVLPFRESRSGMVLGELLVMFGSPVCALANELSLAAYWQRSPSFKRTSKAKLAETLVRALGLEPRTDGLEVRLYSLQPRAATLQSQRFVMWAHGPNSVPRLKGRSGRVGRASWGKKAFIYVLRKKEKKVN